jgi:hypothetical protein
MLIATPYAEVLFHQDNRMVKYPYERQWVLFSLAQDHIRILVIRNLHIVISDIPRQMKAHEAYSVKMIKKTLSHRSVLIN